MPTKRGEPEKPDSELGTNKPPHAPKKRPLTPFEARAVDIYNIGWQIMDMAPNALTNDFFIDSENTINEILKVAFLEHQPPELQEKLLDFLGLMTEYAYQIYNNKGFTKDRSFVRAIKQTGMEMIRLSYSINPDLRNKTGQT